VKKLVILALPVIVVALAFLAISATRDSASAQVVEQGRVRIECTQTQVPSEENSWVGEVTCTLTVDVLDPAPDYTLTLIVLYLDVDQSGTPTFGDRLICWEIPQLNVGTCP
jgi:hypothetical protein